MRKSNQPKNVVLAFRIFSNCNHSDFWTPSNPLLFQYSAPTLKHCAESSNLELLSSTTTVLQSTSIGFWQTFSQAKGIWVYWVCWEFHSFQSRNPEHQDKNHKVIILGNQPKTNWKKLSKSYLANFQRVRNSIFISSRILETNLRNPDYTTPNRSRKRTKWRSSSAWGSKDDLFPVGQNPT